MNGGGFWRQDKWKKHAERGENTKPHVDSHRNDDGMKALFLCPAKLGVCQVAGLILFRWKTSTQAIFLVISGTFECCHIEPFNYFS